MSTAEPRTPAEIYAEIRTVQHLPKPSLADVFTVEAQRSRMIADLWEELHMAAIKDSSLPDWVIASTLAASIDAATRAVATVKVAERYEHRAPSADEIGWTVAPSWSPEEAAILAMPEPKWHQCPECKHDIALHRMAGCDLRDCDCPQPFGRIIPGDPDPA
jgi:hypothetical protein